MAETVKQHYITIQEFMVKELELKGNELIAYALVYGFSQDEESYFKGSLSYVAKWLNCSKTTAHSILNKLADDGFLEKKEKIVNGVKLCDYTAVVPNKTELKEVKERKENRKEKEKSERRSKNLNTPSKNYNGRSKNTNWYSKNLNEGVQKSVTHNTRDILNDNKDENINDNLDKGRNINIVDEKVDTISSKKSLPTSDRKKNREELKELEQDMIKRFAKIGNQYDVSETVLRNVVSAFMRYMENYTKRTNKVHPILTDKTLEKIFVTMASVSDEEYTHFDNVAEQEPDRNGLSYLDEMVDEHFRAEHNADTDWHISHFANQNYLDMIAQHIVEWG